MLRLTVGSNFACSIMISASRLSLVCRPIWISRLFCSAFNTASASDMASRRSVGTGLVTSRPNDALAVHSRSAVALPMHRHPGGLDWP